MIILTPTGIPTGESFGARPLESPTVLATGIPSEEAFSAVRLGRTIAAVGITSTEATGIASLVDILTPLGIEEPSILGVPTLSFPLVPSGVAFSRSQRPLSASERLSGVLLNQNAIPSENSSLSLDTYTANTYQYYQEFRLPDDYARGTVIQRIPPLTGFQIFVGIDPGLKDVAALDWTLEHQVADAWEQLDSGLAVGAELDGTEVWFTIYTDSPVSINADWLGDKFRIGIQGRNPIAQTFKQEVPYSDGTAIIEGQRVPILLIAGAAHHFNFNGTPSSLYLDAQSDKAYYSVERGVTQVWATAPNPLQTQGVSVTDESGSPLGLDGLPTVDPSAIASLSFRILAGIAEEGTDFLGNRYRSVIHTTTVENISTLTNAHQDQFWLSKPNPSKFAVESLYFDISERDQKRTIDSVLIDPLTPGVYFSVYYSSEGNPATTNAEWEDKLWTRVPDLFKMEKRETLPLPQPITARYVKLEFTQLQPKWYAPGNFQKPILYKKHPKWVLDYFLLRFATDQNTQDSFIARQLKVSFDALDLAYNYYVDDLDRQPLSIDSLGTQDEAEIQTFLAQRSDSSDAIDGGTLAKIRARLAPYAVQLGSQSGFDYLLSTYSAGNGATDTGFIVPEHPIEILPAASASNNQVSTIDRDALIYERGSSPMFFFVTCRHRYRMVSATFDNDKGYFAGVKELAFLRERYTKAYDSPLYIESAGDTLNSERNDFVNSDGIWTTHEL